MAGTEFHNKEYDNTTLLKLEIFKKYIREWLPVFMKQERIRHQRFRMKNSSQTL